MAVTALPTRESAFLAFSLNFSTKITATPTVFGLSAAQATTYAASHAAFATALAAATNPTTRTKGTIAAKTDQFRSTRDQLGMLCKIVMAQLSVTNEQRISLGLSPRTIPQPIPAPSVPPVMVVVSVDGRMVKLQLSDGGSAKKKSKPPGVKGCSVFSFVGPVAPTNPADYKFEGSTTRTSFDVLFPESCTPGTVVWLTAMWVNERLISGPACNPMSTRVQFPTSMQMAA